MVTENNNNPNFSPDRGPNSHDESNELESLAVRLAPEDIRVGDFIAPLFDLNQFPIRECDPGFAPGQTVPKASVVTLRMVDPFPSVYRVLAVALPLILVEDADGDQSLVTVRARQFARLPQAMGLLAMRDLDRRRQREAEAERRRLRRRSSPRLRYCDGRGRNGAD